MQEVAEPEKILTGDTALEEDSNAQENQESDESGVTSAEETDELQKKMWLLHLRMTRRMKWQRRRVRIRKVEVKR